MRKILGISVVTFLLGAVAWADPVQPGFDVVIHHGSPPGTLHAGVFLLTWMNPADSSTGSFNTFCLEENETIQYGKHYTVLSVGHNVDNAPGGLNTLEGETAWLYLMYRTNLSALTGWDNTNDSADALQALIWYYQGHTVPSLSAGAQAFYDAWKTIADGLTNTQKMDALDLVQAINPVDIDPTTGAVTHVQSMLQIVGVPEPMTLLLLGTGLLGFGLITRPRRRA